MSFDIFGLGQGLNNLQNNLFQQDANRYERQFEREMSEEEFARAVEMWERTNTYNSPVEQRKRLIAAGLNPALMYGKAASPGIASPAPSWQAPKSGHYGENMSVAMGSLNGMQGLLSAYNDLRKTNADVELKNAQQNLTINKANMANMLANMMGIGEPDWRTTPYWRNWARQNTAEASLAEAAARKKAATANWAEEKWKLYDAQGINLDQLTNFGKILEKKMGAEAAAILDAVLGKVKSR